MTGIRPSSFVGSVRDFVSGRQKRFDGFYHILDTDRFETFYVIPAYEIRHRLMNKTGRAFNSGMERDAKINRRYHLFGRSRAEYRYTGLIES